MPNRAIRHTRKYYEEAFVRHGATPRGVDWNTQLSQDVRFEHLVTNRILKSRSILDFGCGYGALLKYLRDRNWKGNYFGIDLVPQAIEAARTAYEDDHQAHFSTSLTQTDREFQTVIANGVLNVRGTISTDEWRQHVRTTLDDIFALSTYAIAFNFLHPWSDLDHRRPHLWYPTKLELAEYTAEKYSRWLEIDQAYPLFETTIRAFREQSSDLSDADDDQTTVAPT